jgi:CheY-like chemotaxis protein
MDTRILVVDDSKATRRVLSALVNSRWTVCGEAESGTAGVKKFQELQPDLVVLDLAMPDIDGIEAARQMQALNPAVPLILFTLLDSWGLQSAARNAGIIRVVSKSEGWELMKSIEEVLAERETATLWHRQPYKMSRTGQKPKTKSAAMR